MSRSSLRRSFAVTHTPIVSLVLLASLVLTSRRAPAQNSPNFTQGGAQSLSTSGSPALAYSNLQGKVFIFYRDNSTGNLFAASALHPDDGVAFGSPVNTGFSMSGPSIAAATVGGDKILVMFQSTTGFMVTTTSDGTTFTTPRDAAIESPNGYYSSVNPGLAYFTGTTGSIYLSINVPGPSGTSLVAVLSSTDGETFTNYVVPVNVAANSGSSLVVYEPSGGATAKLALAFTQGTGNTPVIAQSTNGSSFTYVIDTTFNIGGTPALVQFDAPGNTENALYVFGRSNYSGNNLYVAGTYDGVHFTSPYEYALSLSQSPAVCNVNYYLVTAFRSNSGSGIDAYSAENN